MMRFLWEYRRNNGVKPEAATVKVSAKSFKSMPIALRASQLGFLSEDARIAPEARVFLPFVGVGSYMTAPFP